MCIIRNKLKKKFVQIENVSLEDPNLSWQGKGLLSYLLSRPDNWTISLSNLIKQGTDGQTATRTALKELEARGYLRRERICDEKGRIVKWEKVIYETPSLNPDWQGAECEPKEAANPKDSYDKPIQPQVIKKEVQVKSEPIEEETNTTKAEPKLENDKKIRDESKVDSVLKFSNDFSEEEKAAMTKMLQGIDKAQGLINVLEKMMSRKEIQNPVGYLKGIIAKYHARQFTPVTNEPSTQPDEKRTQSVTRKKSWVEKEDEKQAAIDACPYCEHNGIIYLITRDGKKSSAKCRHDLPNNGEKLLDYARKVDAIIDSAKPGYRGHREAEEVPKLKKTTTELQQEFLNALKNFGRNNSFGGPRDHDE